MATVVENVQLEGEFQAKVICFILGAGSLIPLNNMWTMGDYYYQVFPTFHPMRTFTIIYQPFALITTLILAHYESRINTRLRNLFGYSLFFAFSLLVVVLDLATSGKGGIGPFIGLCAVFGCFGITHAFVQGGVCGELSFMCPKFIQAFISGINASGVVACCLRLFTKYYFEKSDHGLRKGALLSLAISTLFELLSIIMYAIYFPRLSIVKYYRSKAALEGANTDLDDRTVADIKNIKANHEVASKKERLSHKKLFRQNIDYAFGVVMIYVLTLSIMPGFLYEDTGVHNLGTWYPLVLMTMYNIMDLAASYIPLIEFMKLESRKGLSNGYLTVCVYTVVPKGYTGPEQNALGNLLALCLLSGVFAGVALGWLWQIGKS
ncbi:equilibrative nucleotide transporter [Trifolium repens]|nr:equilibrative nucleotide transporter [Trifolium repens]